MLLPHIAEICELGIILSLLLFLLSISTHTSLIFPSSISTFSSLHFRVTLSQRFSTPMFLPFIRFTFCIMNNVRCSLKAVTWGIRTGHCTAPWARNARLSLRLLRWRRSYCPITSSLPAPAVAPVRCRCWRRSRVYQWRHLSAASPYRQSSTYLRPSKRRTPAMYRSTRATLTW